jgi:phosphinothricin tripeptide acetyl hydrolase
VTADERELILELLALNRPRPGTTLAERRAQYDRAVAAFAGVYEPEPVGAPVLVGQACAEWSRLAGPDAPAVLYLHGGSYTMGSPLSHRHLAQAIGAELGAAVLTLDYRRPPEAPFPAAVDDAVAAYRVLRDSGTPAGRIAVCGDSAGAGLSLALLQRLRAAGEAMPAAVACLSPWTDLACALRSHATHAARDPLLRTDDLRAMARLYLGTTGVDEPEASPVYADLSGLPPMLVQVGTEEILLDDARALASRARAAGVSVEYQEWPDMFHVWQYYFPLLSEGRDAISAIGRFLGTAFNRTTWETRDT